MSGMGGLGQALRVTTVTVGAGLIAAVASGVYYVSSRAHAIGGLLPITAFLLVSAAAIGLAELIGTLLWNVLDVESTAAHLLVAALVYAGVFLVSRRLFLVEQQRHLWKVLAVAAGAVVLVALAWLVQTPAFHNWRTYGKWR